MTLSQVSTLLHADHRDREKWWPGATQGCHHQSDLSQSQLVIFFNLTPLTPPSLHYSTNHSPGIVSATPDCQYSTDNDAAADDVKISRRKEV